MIAFSEYTLSIQKQATHREIVMQYDKQTISF